VLASVNSGHGRARRSGCRVRRRRERGPAEICSGARRTRRISRLVGRGPPLGGDSPPRRPVRRACQSRLSSRPHRHRAATPTAVRCVSRRQRTQHPRYGRPWRFPRRSNRLSTRALPWHRSVRQQAARLTPGGTKQRHNYGDHPCHTTTPPPAQCRPSVGLWRLRRVVARTSAALLIRGRIQAGQGVVTLVADQLDPLELGVAVH
jgi:hypothetical protein